jgi:hypothetical protein
MIGNDYELTVMCRTRHVLYAGDLVREPSGGTRVDPVYRFNIARTSCSSVGTLFVTMSQTISESTPKYS